MAILPPLSDTVLGHAADNLTPQAPTALDQMKKGQELQTNQFTLQLNKANALNDIIGSVTSAPDDQKESVYQQALDRASKLGLDISSAPDHYDPGFVTSVAAQSDKALKFLQAKAQIAIAQAKLQNESLSASGTAARGAADLIRSGNPQQASSILNAANANIGAPTGSGAIPQQIDNSATSSLGTSTSQTVTPLQGPAELEAQKQQGKDWAKYKETAASHAAGAAEMLPYIYSIKNHNENMAIPTGPGIGKLAALTPEGVAMQKDSQNLLQASMKALTGIGNRVMNTELNAINQSNPNVNAYKNVNKEIIDQKEYIAKWMQFRSQALQKLDDAGVRSPSKAENIMTKIYQEADGLDPQTGKVDLTALDRAPKLLDDIIKKGVNSKAADPTTWVTPDGKEVGPEAMVKAQLKFKMNKQQIIKKYDLKEAN